MNNTKESFKNKWENNPDLVFSETLREDSDIFKWILSRNGFSTPRQFELFLSDKKRILDAGCGNGRITALLRKYSDPKNTQIVAIDLVASTIAQKKLSGAHNILFYSKDLLGDLSDIGKFDFIYCQEVLHHTSNPFKSFQNLVSLLNKGGEIAIYVYKKKAPTREFVDDYVRSTIAGKDYESAMKICEDITTIGKILHEKDIKIRVPEIAVLEIKEGEYNLQRFIYHFFMKCFWNPDISFHENAVINYDWYHPHNCSRHTIEEITDWFKSENLKITHSHSDFYGITMKGFKS